MKTFFAPPALAFAALLAAAPALAQAPAPTAPLPEISLEQARRIAMENGVLRIEEIKLDDGVWEIEGRDNAGAEIEMNLRAIDGAIVKIERERPVTAGSTKP